MIDQKKRTYHFGNSSLLSLKLVLLEAEKDLPPRIPKGQRDVNEELALQLIAGMKKKYKRPRPFVGGPWIEKVTVTS